MLPWNIPLADELKRNIINRAVILSRDSSFVFGTNQNGIYVVDKQGMLRYRFNKDSGLQDNTVLALHEDSRQQLWIGLDQGIDLIGLSSRIISYQASDNPLGSAYAAAIWHGQLYIGTNKGVFRKKWLSNEPFRIVHGLEGQTWDLQVCDDQLICGHNDATYRIDENGIQKLSDITGGWVILRIETGKDTLLLQGAYNGLHVYKKKNRGFWTYAYPVKGIPPIPIRQIVRDDSGNFWLGHAYKGLFRTRLTARLIQRRSGKNIPAWTTCPVNFLWKY